MAKEENIKCVSFEDNYQKALVNLIYTSGWVNNLMRPKFELYNLTHQQFNILQILRGQYPNPATVSFLKERIIDKMSDVSRIVERLIQKGFVSRCTNPRDRRAVDIRISDIGLDILKRMDIDFKPSVLFERNLTEKEADQLNCLLDKMRG
jgi:DNA-binding MarR family transcriptional regulator